jgi:glycosyltransferase involved in cell wall biosynthesis
VVIPVHDEEEAIGPVLDELFPVLEGLGGGHEVIVVDDGSTDGTLALLRARRETDPALRVLSLRPRSGQSAAFEAGFRHARGSILVTLDGDGQNVPADIPRVVEALAGNDAVFGVRAERSDPPVRKLAQRVANLVRNRVLGSSYRDVGCSLKAFRRDIIAGATLYNGLHRFFPYLVEMRGGRGVEIEVSHRPRVRGRSKYSALGRWRETSADLWMVRRMMRRSLRYEAIEVR